MGGSLGVGANGRAGLMVMGDKDEEPMGVVTASYPGVWI